jgi:tetratricopeptide (TPR) repeat protein
MEYLSGGSLEERLRDGGPVSPGQALEWLEQAANALDAAHREGVVHRDVKPANLLLDRHGRIHVADFGIASAAGLDSLTQTGTVLGTASYLSPEQAMGERATPASDLYSLGVVAFELLTGRRPFEADSVAAEAAAHVTGDIPSVSPELDPVFAKALAKHPSARYASAAELVAALRASFERAAGPTRVIVRPRRRSPWLLPLGVLLLLAGVIGAIVASRGGSGHGRAATVVQRVTAPGQTVVTTVVTTAAAPPSTDPVAENNQAWNLMQQGQYAAALPLLQNAVQQLQGRNDLETAYANFNLGYTLLQLGQCDQAVQYLEVAKSLEPDRHEVHDALHQAKHCSGGGDGGD